MRASLGFLGLLLVFLTAPNASAQFGFPNDNVCTSPHGKPGKCVNVKTCPELLSLLQQKPLTQATIKFLQQSQCGYEDRDPKVCCVSAYNQPDPSRPSGIVDPSPVEVRFHQNIRLLDQRRCGPISADKIVGGNRTDINELPWMALIAYRNSRKPNSKSEFHCGGSVINKRYILTAAHCVTSLPSTLVPIGVRVGEHDLSTERDCMFEGTEDEYCAEKYQDFLIQNYIYHPQFSRSELVNDIALIRVDRDIDFRPTNARPICLPIGSAAKLPNKNMIVAGWGIMELNISSPELLKLLVPRFPQDQCIDIYKRKSLNITPKQICYGGELGKDSCQGDSGGPLMAPTVYNGNPRYVQYGIVSYGLQRCGQLKDFPGVYTRVDQYLDWILDNMRD